MKFSMIVMDLDGTLLREDRSISPKTQQVLNACREGGSKLVFATNRAKEAVMRFGELLQPWAMILSSGAQVLVGDTCIYQRRLAGDIADALLARCAQEPSVIHISARLAQAHYANYDPNHPDYMDSVYCDFSRPLGQEAEKISFASTSPAFTQNLREAFPSCHIAGFTGEQWYRAVPKEVNKETALQVLADYGGLSLEEAVAFGDDDIDVGMLRLCGTGVAMGNGNERVKAAASHVCQSNEEDGLARWLEANWKN